MGLLFSDIPELEGSNTEIALANLSELENEFQLLVERRLAHLSELAEAIVKDGEDADIIKSIILSIKSEGGADSDSLIDENKHDSDVIYSKLSLIERMTILKDVFDRIGNDKKNLLKFFDIGAVVPISNDASERIAYLKNSYNDEAFMQFSSLFTSCRAAYFEIIPDVCKSVYNNECEYCILPIETSADGKLLSFYEMILKYNFKINAVYDLLHNDDKGYTRYALLSKRFDLYRTSLRSKARNRYFEFIVSDDSVPIDELLVAASFCSLRLSRIDTLGVFGSKSEKGRRICPVFRVDGADLQTFFSFLAIDCPGFIPLGLYMQI